MSLSLEDLTSEELEKSSISDRQSQDKYSSGQKTPRVIRPTFLHIFSAPDPVHVFHNGIDVTPKKLLTKQYKLSLFKFDLENELGGLTSRRSRSSAISTQLRGRAETTARISGKRRTVQLSLGNIVQGVGRDIDFLIEDTKDIASDIYLPKMTTKLTYPEEIKLFLEETETVYLFELPSVTEIKGTEEGGLVEQENENYEYLTVGKGRNRRTISTEAQTVACILKTRHTIAPRPEVCDNYAYASVWDMFDSYKKLQQSDTSIKTEETEGVLEFAKRLKENVDHKKVDNVIEKLMQNVNFLNAVNITERVLANNTYKLQQEDFKGLLIRNEEQTQDYNYTLNLLWTFEYAKIARRPVTVFTTNPTNSDIIAVGYGKYNYSENMHGVACIWSIKNPKQPERYYEFERSLSTMCFSNQNPNILAIGLYSGDICLIDIMSYEKFIITKNPKHSTPSEQPIWHMRWFFHQYLHCNIEQIIALSQDGTITTCRQTKTQELSCQHVMRVLRTESNIKNVFEEDSCETNAIPIFRNTICNSYCPHPLVADIYYLGTLDGTIYKCSTNYVHQHIDFFIAHDGPVHGIQFSPFCNEIFMSCSADWTVKIWREKIRVPLLVLKTDIVPFFGITFCPVHSTIIAAISSNKLYIWNIEHKIDTPLLVYELPSKQLTKVDFSKNGKSILVGDILGSVHMLSLVGVTTPKEDQCIFLEKAIRKMLIIRPDLLQQLNKLGELARTDHKITQ